MLDKRLPIVAAGLAMIALSGCQNVRDAAGITKKAPDEFAVLRRARRSIPIEAPRWSYGEGGPAMVTKM